MTASFVQWFNNMALLGSFVVLYFFMVILISTNVMYVQRLVNVVEREKFLFFSRSHLLSQHEMVYFYENLGRNKNVVFFQGLLSVHDTVAQKDYEPRLPSLAAEGDEAEEDSVRIIRLMKSKEPLVSVSGELKYFPTSLY